MSSESDAERELNAAERRIHAEIYGEATFVYDHFILDEDQRAVPVGMGTWAVWMQANRSRKIVRQETVRGYWISTVFLGMNHNFHGEGPPLIFETMVFQGEKSDLFCERYATLDEAEVGHAHIAAYIGACGRPPGEEE